MYRISEQDFENIVKSSIKNIPSKYIEKLDNVNFYIADYPSQQQAKKLKIRNCDSLLSLFEGVPLTERNGGYSITLPDTITIFKNSHEEYSDNLAELKSNVNNTVWHEVAHFFGLSHKDIYAREKKYK